MNEYHCHMLIRSLVGLSCTKPLSVTYRSWSIESKFVSVACGCIFGLHSPSEPVTRKACACQDHGGDMQTRASASSCAFYESASASPDAAENILSLLYCLPNSRGTAGGISHSHSHMHTQSVRKDKKAGLFPPA